VLGYRVGPRPADRIPPIRPCRRRPVLHSRYRSQNKANGECTRYSLLADRMPLKPLRRLSKAYHGLISSSKLTEQFQSDEIKHTDGADKCSAQNDVVSSNTQSEGIVSVPSILTNLPSEILRCIIDHLPPESLLILRQTCQNLKHCIILSSDQVSHADRVQYLALRVRDSPYSSNGWIVCAPCGRIRPKSAFTDATSSLYGEPRVTDCVRHTRIWVCPHRSYSYDEVSTLAKQRPAGSLLLNDTNRMCCGLPQCDLWFSHKMCLNRMNPTLHELYSSILVSRIRHASRNVRQTILENFTEAQLGLILAKMKVPICNHLLLNDPSMVEKFSPRYAAVEITDLRPNAKNPNVRSSHLHRASCSACAAAGTHTCCRFNIQIISEGAWTFIDLRVILTRRLGTLLEFKERDPDWWNHAMTLEKLSRFVHTW
jgi:F-box domain